jgi:hypothetical protein
MPQYIAEATQTATGKVALASVVPQGSDSSKGYEAALYATPGQVASVTCRPLAGITKALPGFPVGGEVEISGTADGNGFVGCDGFPFVSPFTHYGFEVTAISGTGASVTHKVLA